MAAERRVILIAEEKLIGPSKKNSSPRQAKKIKTKYPGVYTKVSFRKIDPNGKPDRCYDIVWYIGDGKYRWEKIGWASEGYTELDAVRIRAERVRTFQATGISPRTNMLTLNESWQIYCKNWLPNLRETKNFTARYNNYLGPKFGDHKLADIKTHHIEEYKHFLVSKPLSPARIKLILSDLRRIMKKMVEWEFYTGPLPKFHMPKVENERLRRFSIQETKDFLLELTLYSCDMYHIAKISSYTGLRLDDVLGLTKDDIDVNEGIIYTDGKTGRHESYIAKSLMIDIVLLVTKANKQGNKYLFTDKSGNRYTSKNVSNQFGRYIACTNINKGITDSKHKYVFHSGRHFFGSVLADEGASLYTIQKMMGHKDSKTTQRYAKFSPNAQRQALKNFDASMTRPIAEESEEEK